MSWQIPPGGWSDAPFPPPPSPDLEARMLAALHRLDPAIADWRRQRLHARLWYGITGHFSTRATEWFAAAYLFQLGLTLAAPPSSFELSPGWKGMADLASETTWAVVMLVVGGLRLLALTINGSFATFRWSPHVRALTAVLACWIWLQVVLSMWAVPGVTGLGTYRITLFLEVWNMWRAFRDTGFVERRRSHGGA